MQLAPVETEKKTVPFSGVPLSVVFAEGDAIERVRRAGEGVIPLEPPYHVSDEDSYFVLPEDIGLEVVDIVADSDIELMNEAMRDGLLVIGSVVKTEEGNMHLHVEQAATPSETLRQGLPYAATVEIGGGSDPVTVINTLPHVQCTVLSALVDDDGLEKMLRRREFLGMSWKVPDSAVDAGVDPTYAWSKRLTNAVGMELALFLEYEELVVLLRPVRFVAAD